MGLFDKIKKAFTTNKTKAEKMINIKSEIKKFFMDLNQFLQYIITSGLQKINFKFQ